MKYNTWEIEEGCKLFGKLLPDGERVNYKTFVELIRKHHTLSNPITKRIYLTINKHTDLYYRRNNTHVKITRI
jgi:hypothetical protein